MYQAMNDGLDARVKRGNGSRGATFRRAKLGFWSRLFRLPVAAGALLAGYLAFFYGVRASLIDLQVVHKMPTASQVLDAHGRPLGRFFEQNRVPMPDGPPPKLLSQAIVATEDQRFWWHPGVDPLGMVRAAIANVMPGGVRQGASTITQQLARNSIGMMQRTYDRKILEIFLAMRIEGQYSKEEILHHYLDRIYYGNGLYGAETASQAFFGKTVRDLTLGEAALLAGMVSGPNSFSPWGRPTDDTKTARTRIQRALDARDRALDRMVRHGFIKEAEADKARKEPFALKPRPDFSGSYALESIRLSLSDDLTEEQLEQGGLTIHSTIDASLQQAAETMVAEGIARIEASKGFPARNRGDLQAAFYCLDPSTGAVRALVGGRNFQETPYNRATQARRQAGSTLKPLLYAIGFKESGFSPASWIENTPFNLNLPDGAARPNGASQYIRINDAIVKSDNYAAVRMGHFVGPEKLASYSQQCGIESAIPPVPSSYLGSCDVALSELVQLYGVFAHQGVWNKPYIVTEVVDDRGKVLFRYIPESRRVFPPQVATQVTGMLENVTRVGTGASLRSKYHFTKPAAGKTGTTDDYKDAWWIGYTSSLAAGVWVGLDQPETIIADGYGARLALPIWARFMNHAQSTYPMIPFPIAAGLDRSELPDRQVVYLSPGQTWHAQSGPGQPHPSERKTSFWDRLFDW